jgi:hypothetical protein
MSAASSAAAAAAARARRGGGHDDESEERLSIVNTVTTDDEAHLSAASQHSTTSLSSSAHTTVHQTNRSAGPVPCSVQQRPAQSESSSDLSCLSSLHSGIPTAFGGVAVLTLCPECCGVIISRQAGASRKAAEPRVQQAQAAEASSAQLGQAARTSRNR